MTEISVDVAKDTDLVDVAKDTDKAVAIAQVELFPLCKITGLSE
ncbi:MAG: hypothetical protein OSB34_08790 [Planktomarina sp.]|nr:hypothetical protein [Planktomarina sp.]